MKVVTASGPATLRSSSGLQGLGVVALAILITAGITVWFVRT